DVRPHRDVLALPALRDQLLSQELFGVHLHHDLRVEVLSKVEIQVGVCVPSETVKTCVAASPIGIDGPAEWHPRDLGNAIDDRLRPDLVEGDTAEFRRVEGAYRCALLEQWDAEASVTFRLGQPEVVPAHGH